MEEYSEAGLEVIIEEDHQTMILSESLINGLTFGDSAEVTGVLQKVISFAREGRASSRVPGAFVEKVALRQFNLSKDIEPVFYLYKVFWEQANTISPDEVVPEVGMSFANVVGEIASNFEGKDRVRFIASSIAFVKQLGSESEDLIGNMIGIAMSLHFKGLNAECLEMCKFLIYLGGTDVPISESLMIEIKELQESATDPSETRGPSA